MSIADHLSLLASNKIGIKEALEEKGIEVGGSPFSHYPDLIEGIKAGGFEIGKILYGKMDRGDGEWLVADGSRVNKDAYPELVDILGEVIPGYATLPNLPPVTHGDITIRPLIQAILED